MTKTKVIMLEEFRGRDFQTNLLKRVINKFQDGIYGVGCHIMDELFIFGFDIQKNKGEFKFGHFLDIFLLCKVVFQTKSQKAYAKSYCKYTEFDYTHSATKYGLVAALPTPIDCLNKLYISGIGIHEYETEIDSKDIMDLFNCTKPIYSYSVLMTGKGPAFENFADKFGMTGINCSKNYASYGDKVSGGLGFLYD